MTFTHLDQNNLPTMVSIQNKQVTQRTATACTQMTFPPEIWDHFKEGDIQGKKGSVTHTALIAGIQGAKLTSQLIPLCHPLALDKIDIQFEWNTTEHTVKILCTVSTEGKTGVEMEALTGSTICALTIYDMCKALSHHIEIGPTQLLSKTGGKSDYIISHKDTISH